MKRVVRVRFRSRRVVVSSRIVVAGSLTLLLILGLALGARSFLGIREVRCQMNDGSPCDEVLMIELQRLLGTPVYRMSSVKLEERVLRALPALRSVELSLRPPATIQAIAEAHQPLYIIEVGESMRFVVSENGTVLRPATEDELQRFVPVYVLREISGNPGEILHPEIHRSISGAVAGFRKTSLTGERVEVIHPAQLELFLPGGKRGIFEGERAEGQLSALQQLLNTATIAEQGKQTIDVRFARPVLR